MKIATIKRTLFLLVSLILACALLCSCAASADNEMGKSDLSADITDESYTGLTDGDVALESEQEISRKLIRTVEITAETKEFSKVMTSIEGAVKDTKGYIQNQSVNNNTYNNTRSANMTLRIPADKLDSFLTTLNKAVNITRQTSNVDDITDEYVDIESHIAALETEQTALLAMLEKAEKLDDIISIQSRLTEVRGDLESYKARQKGYDTLVAYATVTLNLNEVERETQSEPSFWTKAGNAFVDGITSFGEVVSAIALFLIAALPYIAVAAVALIVALVIAKKSKKARTKKTEKEENKE